MVTPQMSPPAVTKDVLEKLAPLMVSNAPPAAGQSRVEVGAPPPGAKSLQPVTPEMVGPTG